MSEDGKLLPCPEMEVEAAKAFAEWAELYPHSANMHGEARAVLTDRIAYAIAAWNARPASPAVADVERLAREASDLRLKAWQTDPNDSPHDYRNNWDKCDAAQNAFLTALRVLRDAEWNAAVEAAADAAARYWIGWPDADNEAAQRGAMDVPAHIVALRRGPAGTPPSDIPDDVLRSRELYRQIEPLPERPMDDAGGAYIALTRGKTPANEATTAFHVEDERAPGKMAAHPRKREQP